MTNVTKMVQSPRRVDAPTPSSSVPMRAPHTAYPSAWRSRSAVTVPSSAPSARLRRNQPAAGMRSATLEEGANAKIAPAATSGARSSDAASSTSRLDTGPFTVHRTATHCTTKRVVSAVTAPAPAAKSSAFVPSMPAIGRYARKRFTMNATVAPVSSAVSTPSSIDFARTRRPATRLKSSPTTNASQPSATCTSGSNSAIMERSTSPSACGPTAKPSPMNSTPEGSPFAERPPTIKLPT